MRSQNSRSLSAHLREAEDHSRLPFHPACPVCRRDRLVGSLDGDELVSRRTQAAIAAGLLAFSTGGVPAAVASPPDEVIEGTAEVVDGGDPDASADFEPGGEELLPSEDVPEAPETSVPSSDVVEDAGPLEQEPVTDVREPVLEASDQVAEPVAGPAPAPEPPDTAAPAPASPPPPSPAPVSNAPQVPQEDAGPVPEGGHRRQARAKRAIEAPSQPRALERLPAAPEPAPSAELAPAVEPGPAAEPAATEPAPATATHVTTRVVARTTKGTAPRGEGRFHVVRPGESLWSIAAELLGDRATVPRIAREVNRLWELNDDVIGTGRPDLVYAGTRLRLR